LVENGGKLAQAMRDANYSENTICSPQKLTGSLGFQKLCDDAGLTDKFLLTALTEDITNKPCRRKPELELGFKVLGRLTEKPESPFPQNNSLHVHFHKDEKILNIISEAFHPNFTDKEYVENLLRNHKISLAQARVDVEYFSSIGPKQKVGEKILGYTNNIPTIVNITAEHAVRENSEKVETEKKIIQAIEKIIKEYYA